MIDLKRFLFVDKDYLLTRWDSCLSILLALPLMAALAYTTDESTGWSTTRGLWIVGILLFVTITAQHRKGVFLIALALTAFRAGIGAIAVSDPSKRLLLIAGALLTGLFVWRVGRDLE